MSPKFRQLGDTTARFLRWWWAELRSCAEDVLAVLAPTWRRPLTAYVDAHRLLIVGGASQPDALLIDLPRAGFSEPLPATLPEPVPAGFQAGRRVHLVVSTGQAFVRRLQLPLVALPHLRTTVALQLPKLLPVDPQHLLTDFEITATDVATKRVELELAALKRTELEPILQTMVAWRLRIATVQLAETPEAPKRFRFSTATDDRQRSVTRRLDRWLIQTAVGLSLGCVALASAQAYRAGQRLEQAQLETQTAAGSALGHRQFLLARLEPLQALAERESRAAAAAVLSAVGDLLPADSWLTTMEIKERSLRLVGISPDAAGLVKRLAGSPLLNDVELRSAMSLGVGTGKDRFEITAEIGPDRPLNP